MSGSLESDNLATSMFPVSPLPPADSRQEKLLEKIEDTEKQLKLYEVVSMLFLLHTNARRTLLDLEHLLSGVESQLVSKWCKQAISNDKNWEKKFYESLFLIKNYKALKQFDIEAVNAVLLFNHCSLIPNIRLELYKVCENVVGSELESLLAEMGESRDKDFRDYLEMYLLKWIVEGKITVDDEINLRLMIDSLKRIHRRELAEKLSHYQYPNSPLEVELNKTMHLEEDYAIIDPNNVGLCVIINQKKFTRDPENPMLVLKERKGTEKDCDALKSMLRTFKFDIETVNDVISSKILDVIHDRIAKFFKPNHSIFVLIILSHGHMGIIYGADSRKIPITAIDLGLLVPQLKGKPKVIIVQACQGDSFLKAPKIEPDAPVTLKEWPKDTLFCMATIPHFASYRHVEKGTWYIQTLCEIFLKYPEKDLCSLLTKINRKLYNEPVFDSEEKIRSIPEFKSRLEKNLYFKKKSNVG